MPCEGVRASSSLGWGVLSRPCFFSESNLLVRLTIGVDSIVIMNKRWMVTGLLLYDEGRRTILFLSPLHMTNIVACLPVLTLEKNRVGVLNFCALELPQDPAWSLRSRIQSPLKIYIGHMRGLCICLERLVMPCKSQGNPFVINKYLTICFKKWI